MEARYTMVTAEDFTSINSVTLNEYYDTVMKKDEHGDYYHQILDKPMDNSISFGDLHRISSKTDPNKIYITNRYMEGGDYSGCYVEKANHAAFLEEYGEYDGVYDVYGGHGSFGVAISLAWLTDPANEEVAERILETLNALESYPLIDEDVLSEMEQEGIDEAWENWARMDYAGDLQNKFGIDFEDTDQLRSVLETVADRINEYWEDDGGSMYIRIERIVEATTLADLKDVEYTKEE